ncbi:MAG: hypothetical protein C4527_04705 [Candidatus Omnitrophota bacterium]|nr:MAG: hypothetical protein C4527_04705 [Candidatus Omnitrophota bacterium]
MRPGRGSRRRRDRIFIFLFLIFFPPMPYQKDDFCPRLCNNLIFQCKSTVSFSRLIWLYANKYDVICAIRLVAFMNRTISLRLWI